MRKESMQNAYMQIISAQYLQEETTRVSSFACTGPGLIKISSTPATNLGQLQRPALLSGSQQLILVRLFRQLVILPRPIEQTPRAGLKLMASRLGRFQLSNTVFQVGNSKRPRPRMGPPSPNLPKLWFGRTRPVAAHFHTNRAQWARGVVGRVRFSIRAVGQLPSR